MRGIRAGGSCELAVGRTSLDGDTFSNRLRRLGTPTVAATAKTVRAGTGPRGLGVKQRHGKMKLRTLTHFAIHPEASAMHLDKMFGDCQTEAGASSFA